MTAVPFDTLELARRLRDEAHFTPEQAEGAAPAIAEAMRVQVATKADLVDLEHRLTIKLGAMQAVLVALVAALVKLL